LVGVLALMFAPHIASAQEQDTPSPFWYVSEYKVPWSKVDSLSSLLRADEELVKEAVRRGNVLESKVLIHHTGDEQNLVYMNKYPTWEAINADPGLGPIATESWGEDRAQARNDAWDWIFETSGGAHRDRIFTEAASLP
jgi:hypothetical protein